MKKYRINLRQAVPALVMLLIPLGLVLLVFTGGCQQIGPKADLSATKSTLDTPSPTLLAIHNGEEASTINSPNSTSWAEVTDAGINTMAGGVPQRAVFFKTDGAGNMQTAFTSPSDIQMAGLEYDPETRALKIKSFSTVTSEPTRAANESLDRLGAYWTALSADQRAARIAELEAASKAGDTFAPVILSLIKAAAGVP